MLTKCEVCGSDVSSEAIACPKCGHPINIATKKVNNVLKKHKWTFINLGILLLYGLIILILSQGIGESLYSREELAVMSRRRDFNNAIMHISLFPVGVAFIMSIVQGIRKKRLTGWIGLLGASLLILIISATMWSNDHMTTLVTGVFYNN